MIGRRSIYLVFSLSLPIIFLLVFFFFPLGNILRISLKPVAAPLGFSGSYLFSVFWFTFWQAALSTLLTIAAGLPAAFLFARFEFRGKGLLRALVTVPFVLPTVVVATAFRALLSPGGVLGALSTYFPGGVSALADLDQSIALILLAHIYYNVAVIIRLVGGFWANLKTDVIESARVLGASPRRAFWEITLPLLLPSILGAATLVFLFSFASFGVILILGGPVFSTLETEIYRQYVTFLRPEVAASLALLQIVFTFLMMWLYARWQRRISVPLDFRPQKVSMRRPRGRRERLAVGMLLSGLSIFMIGPLFLLAWRSLVDREGSLTLAYYRALPELRRGSITFIAPLIAVRNSIGYALMTMAAAVFLGLMTTTSLISRSRWRSWLEPLFMLPLGASAVTLGLGYVVTFRTLRTSPLLVLIAHVLVALPFVVRSLLPVMQGIRDNLRESAAVLGASPPRVWREIDLPIVGRAILVAAVFAFTMSMGEFGATSFIIRPNSSYLTMPVAIERYLVQPGALNFGQALAMSTILMLVCVGGFVAIERFRYADIGEF